jgi:WD40 repeat protein
LDAEAKRGEGRQRGSRQPKTKMDEPPRDVIQSRPPIKRDNVEVAPKELNRLAWVNALTFSRDGSRLATIQNIGDGSLINVLQVWNFETNKEIVKLYQGNDDIRLPAFSPDGKRCACHYFYGSKVKVWDLDSGAELATFQAPKGVRFTDRVLQFSPDGESLFTCTDARIYRMDLADRSIRLLEESAMKGDFRLAVSPNERDLVLAAVDLHRVDPNNGRLASKKKKVGRVEAMAFSGDGKTLALACFESHVELLDGTSWESRGILQRDKSNRFVCYTRIQMSNDGKFMIGLPYFDKDRGTFKTVDYWDVATKKWHSIEFDGFYHAALSPDGRTLIVAPPQSYLVFVDPVTKQKKANFP